eukprot:165870-Pelagomonas_calceolata.AAC.2
MVANVNPKIGYKHIEIAGHTREVGVQTGRGPNLVVCDRSRLGSKLGFSNVGGGDWLSKLGMSSQTCPRRRGGNLASHRKQKVCGNDSDRHTVILNNLFPDYYPHLIRNRRGPSGRDGRAALKDKLPLQELRRELWREMEQDCAAAAHHQQAAILGKACVLACGSREASSSREGQRARVGTPLRSFDERRTAGMRALQGAKGVVLHASKTDLPPLVVEVLSHEGLEQRAASLHQGQAPGRLESFCSWLSSRSNYSKVSNLPLS